MHTPKPRAAFPALFVVAVTAAFGSAVAQPFGDAPPQAPVVHPRAAPLSPAPPPGAARPGAPSGATLAPDVAAAITAADRSPPSRWQAGKERLRAALGLHLLAPNGPREHWLAAHFDATDIASRVANLAAARVSSPDNRLYLASLAGACMQPTRPQLDACAAVDRVADWATRDRDNGVPEILLADRALARRDPDTAVADVEEAANARRFDDYWSAAEAEWWDYLSSYPSDLDPAGKAEAAATWASEHDPEWATALRAVCIDAVGANARLRGACAKLGTAMAERAATFALRRAGARIASVNADGSAARAAADALQARALAASARCAAAQPDFASAFESADRAVRERAVAAYARWVALRAELGEAAACAKSPG
ncbi:MAG: hypothetical protein JSS46_16045 [Proteobacteria bacterium]|jgi:hypothetical protein|nr:hypothetical protein [Pseudomonadota bacterium]